ncbi:MAG: hypothetical protein COW11_02495 [Candidatus Omnitrophica bacterium CG12_big_fil_rev_8_21_14_0_65_43_15]|uniref:Undecaprenyl-diphosphatase n=1 Tax=Candidatus Taenaricola geysiri TaxID=1974752 RepID=A0A2J0LHB6_9BACT|nr:MAG: hypothetical protein AUJ89_00805 [Candidatus Omnitrophica bacterium CG1_02_43_210]PIR65454.1 MAG: hypothetical protein COU52_04165 [Candidatus Omnitrophica bacterium CG10_big_fil_rev_8_21_14_0_10_43_8]PIV11615.1 MAG: hypothetical protein COS48_05105 [Candidatus Omnitrophica bacterium CG03_land_8_20_14_0_80_43_22]PIW66589.1 MAG: hypothetical protein COW11_02495 [Candidatus Omnitrophica bacterium CG12_big_fil_rev_8_21_14_0_65_43_15]PIW80370.1 MAG: hypothetical protein COZ98_02670 [Candida
MTIFQAILSGILQGITEFFPISSTGHLVILHHFFGFKESQIFFDIMLHIATGLAVVVYFRKDIINLFTSEKNLGMLVVLGSVPTFFIGFLFADFIERFFVHVELVGAALLFTGAFLIVSDIINKKILREKHIEKRETMLYPWKAIVVGIAQGVALIPGISRSGATISAGLVCGLGSTLAFRFSFLLLIPATLGAVIFKLKDVATPIPAAGPMLAGGASAFFVGLLALHLLSRILRRGKIYIFGYYCIAVGLLIILI